MKTIKPKYCSVCGGNLIPLKQVVKTPAHYDIYTGLYVSETSSVSENTSHLVCENQKYGLFVKSHTELAYYGGKWCIPVQPLFD